MLRTIVRRVSWTLLGIVVAGGSEAQAAFAHVIINSQPHSYIGGGTNHDFSDANATVQIDGTLANGVPTFLDFFVNYSNVTTTHDYSMLNFSTAGLGIALQTGTYTNAQRAAFAPTGSPGLDVSYSSQGSNTLTGSFTITNISYTMAQGQYVLNSFAATFDQVSDNNTSHITGSITYGAVVPEPGSLVLLGMGCIGAATYARKRQSR